MTPLEQPHNPGSLTDSPPSHEGNGSQPHNPSQGLAAATANGSPAGRSLPSRTAGRRGWLRYIIGFTALALGIAGVSAYVLTRPAAARPDVLIHVVKREALNVTVVEKGTLESAENKDVVCKVKAGSKSTGYATTINWVIEDGSTVKAGQLLVILDDSALQDQFRDQRIKVDTADADKVTAEKNYDITIKRNQAAVAVADNALNSAEIELEKLIGLEYDSTRVGLGSVLGAPVTLSESGAFQQEVDDLTGQVRLAESEVEQNLERSAWAERMVKQKYMSPAQAQAERSKLDSSTEKLRGLRAKLNQLKTYDRRQRLADARSKVVKARLDLDQAKLLEDAERVQAEKARETKRSIARQEQEKLDDIVAQIKECKVLAPQDGMVVYFKQESGRFGSTPQGLIEQGAQVKEGQKLMRIPNLDVMQVNTKVHEAMVGRIRGDVRVSKRLVEKFQVGQLANPDLFTRLVSQQPGFQEIVREELRDKDYFIKTFGQRASVRVDAMPDRLLSGRVKSVAAVASATDSWASDIKLFPTVVLIEEKVEGLKPDGTAEVTIHVNGVENVLCVPVQAVIGGTEMGAKRKVFVRNATGGFDEKEVVLGIYNEKMVEVREGLTEGDAVVINPKVLMGDNKAKTRDGDNTGGGEGKGEKGAGPPGEGGPKKGGGKKNFPPPSEGLPPGEGLPGGGPGGAGGRPNKGQ